MVTRLLTEITAYFEYLTRQHGDYVAFHNVKIPLEGYMAQLAPYNINRNPYCLYVKSKQEVWNTCIARQERLWIAAQAALFMELAMRGWENSCFRF